MSQTEATTILTAMKMTRVVQTRSSIRWLEIFKIVLKKVQTKCLQTSIIMNLMVSRKTIGIFSAKFFTFNAKTILFMLTIHYLFIFQIRIKTMPLNLMAQ